MQKVFIFLFAFLFFQSINAQVFISEFHYDNTGVDVGEFIEIFGPKDADLAGWSIVLYNDDSGVDAQGNLLASVDNIINLSGIIPDENGFAGVLSFDIPGLSNSCYGIALVNPNEDVIQFISYECSSGLLAVDGPAQGMIADALSVGETGTTPVGSSISIDPFFTNQYVITPDDTPGLINGVHYIYNNFPIGLENLNMTTECGNLGFVINISFLNTYNYTSSSLFSLNIEGNESNYDFIDIVPVIGVDSVFLTIPFGSTIPDISTMSLSTNVYDYPTIFYSVITIPTCASTAGACQNAIPITTIDNSCTQITQGTFIGTGNNDDLCQSNTIDRYFSINTSVTGTYTFTAMNNPIDINIAVIDTCGGNLFDCGVNELEVILFENQTRFIEFSVPNLEDNFIDFEFCVQLDTIDTSNNDNNVGIDINDPIQKLHVDGAIAIGNTSIPFPGAIRFNGHDSEVFLSGNWRSITSGDDNLGNHDATMNLNMNSNKITKLLTPTLSTDAANKAYVDAHEDLDADATNEFQQLFTTVNNSGDRIITILPNGNEINIGSSGGGGSSTANWNTMVNIPSGFDDDIDNVNDSDSDPSNELLSSVSITGGILKLTENSSSAVSVDISSVNYWDIDTNNDLTYSPNATDLMTIEGSTGDVGLGGSPTSDLHIYQGNNGSADGIILQNTSDNSTFRLYVSSGSNDLRFYSTSSGSSILAAIDDVTGSYSALSDRRLKNSIKSLDFDWNKFMQINPVSYQFKHDSEATLQMGVIAQELDQLYPQFVKYHKDNDLYHVKYSEMSVLAIRAIQEQQKTIDSQEKEIDDLEKRINRLELLITEKNK